MKQYTISIVVDLEKNIAYLPLATVSEKENLAAGDALWSLAENWTVLTSELSQQMIEIYKDLPNEAAHTPTSVLANFLITHHNKNIQFQVVANEI